MILKVLRIKPEDKDVFSIILDKPTGFSFYAGQYLDVELPVKDPLGNTRDFTISSSPSEDFLMITTKKGISDFKKAMENLKPGDSITTSHPAGTFILDESSPAVFITGGIGITPFRSIIKYAVDYHLKTPITLIYSNSDNNFLFKKELDEWQKVYPLLEIVYRVTSHHGRLTQLPASRGEPTTRFARLAARLAARRATYHLPIYYLAGPPKMVDDFAGMLLETSIDETNIRYDRFDGY